MTATTPSHALSSSAAPAPQSVTVGDEALLARLRAGDPTAGEALVERYHEPLMRYLRRLTGSDHAAEELHQQAWMSVLDHIDRFDASQVAGGFKAWLYRIATNKAHDAFRRAGRERAVTKGLRLVAAADVAAPADDRLESMQQEQKLRDAIDRLPEAQKQVLLLRYYSNLKFAEIAELLGCPLNTALGRMHKAMLRLREIMER